MVEWLLVGALLCSTADKHSWPADLCSSILLVLPVAHKFIRNLETLCEFQCAGLTSDFYCELR